jgi:hypothetical protein
MTSGINYSKISKPRKPQNPNLRVFSPTNAPLKKLCMTSPQPTNITGKPQSKYRLRSKEAARTTPAPGASKAGQNWRNFAQSGRKEIQQKLRHMGVCVAGF